MRNVFTLYFFLLLSVIISVNTNKTLAQAELRLSIRMLQTEYVTNESEYITQLNMLVSCKNTSKSTLNITKFQFCSFRSYKDEGYYIEAVNEKNKPVNIDTQTDIDWVVDPIDGIEIKKGETFVDTLSTHIYHFEPGKYKIRLVYDRANNSKPGSKTSNIKPVYSNWATITVTK